MSEIYQIFGFVSFWTTVIVVLLAVYTSLPTVDSDWYVWLFGRKWLAEAYLKSFTFYYYAPNYLRNLNAITFRFNTYPRRKMQSLAYKSWEKRFASRYDDWTYNWSAQILAQAERPLKN